MQEAYFKDIRKQIIPILEGAKRDISIAMAWFTSRELFTSLLGCLNRGVHVELVLLDHVINFMDYAPDFNEFIKAGGVLHIANANVGFMHHKFCVIDDSRIITGSYNWTYYAETRNVENILISDDASLVMPFKNEFLRLTTLIAKTSSSPRLTCNDIEALDNVDFRELNCEIGYICEAQSLPVKKVFQTHTEVSRIDIRLVPFAKYDVGIWAIGNEGREYLHTFIKAGTQLPFKSEAQKFFFDSEVEKALPCRISDCVVANKEYHTIKDADLMQLAQGTSDDNLRIVLSMSLDDNGSLRLDASCDKSGQRLNISNLNKELVEYKQK